MDGFARYLLANHRDTLFDRPRVTFASSKDEPLVQLADVICGTLARTYDMTKTTEKSAELLAVIRQDHAILIDEWPVRYRPASGTGSVVPGDPADDDLARYSIARADELASGGRPEVALAPSGAPEVPSNTRTTPFEGVVATAISRSVTAPLRVGHSRHGMMLEPRR